MDHRLLDIIACPACKGKLSYNIGDSELVCKFDRLAYPIHDGIPVMLTTEAREILSEEVKS
ncbi:Trm112 family protein [Candidatus Enterovibrio altilux]|uniref:UPF0434 protein BTN50_1557 n=1 Tax=Candidatus Enterovibrio altilux TaxID=1927128 RepID=A0A291BAJ9_9GAMM|nr:Trm112 family protein [Candidatus Enterovibrio luxaltus]ATF10030.1 Protein YcaR [Candidatus Enterovibrio luxaltus]